MGLVHSYNLSEPGFVHAVQLTLLIALIVVPLNAVFGLCAVWQSRHNFPGRAL
jgi:sulfate transport system permease protein